MNSTGLKVKATAPKSGLVKVAVHCSAFGKGLQIGLFNSCKEGKVVQIGLLNKIGKRTIPLLNFKLKD